jgi:hypothetical protein
MEPNFLFISLDSGEFTCHNADTGAEIFSFNKRIEARDSINKKMTVTKIPLDEKDKEKQINILKKTTEKHGKSKNVTSVQPSHADLLSGTSIKSLTPPPLAPNATSSHITTLTAPPPRVLPPTPQIIQDHTTHLQSNPLITHCISLHPQYKHTVLTYSLDGCMRIYSSKYKVMLVKVRCFVSSVALAVDSNMVLVALGTPDGCLFQFYFIFLFFIDIIFYYMFDI